MIRIILKSINEASPGTEFIEIEDAEGRSINIGKRLERDGYQVIELTAQDILDLSGDDLPMIPAPGGSAWDLKGAVMAPVEYRLLCDPESKGLSRAVTKHLQDGWELYGDPMVVYIHEYRGASPLNGRVRYYQAVIKK